VYLILSKKFDKYISYVGYTKNINNRLYLHNNSKGAKFTKGRKWKIAYKKKYNNKSKAMKEEYKLKKNIKLRNKIKANYII
jgi:putative endonuclease